MAKKNYYAVKNGRIPGIYTTWEECKKQVQGYSGAVYKGFETMEEAKGFMGSFLSEDNSQKVCLEDEKKDDLERTDSAIAYVDGSYHPGSGAFSCGVVFLWQGKELHFKEKYEDPVLSSMRNVAGEIKGSELAMKYALEQRIPKLEIYHDYQGIASWCNGEWQTKKEGTKQYREFYLDASKKIKITFHKVKGHSGVIYNEIADQLAKQALGLL
ncbi:MAG: viroplasmin family protein [Fusicatenibacter sp.]|nr:ribonuclease H family protein [Fusicatenibacter sp.]